MKYRLLYLMTFGYLLSGCDPGVDMDNIDVRNLYAVSSFISPQDTAFHLYLYQAFEIGETANRDSAIVENATVIISNGNINDTLYYNPGSQRYEDNEPKLAIKPLSAYSLEVKVPPSTVLKASCTIPPTPPVAQITGRKETEDFLFSVQWKNPSDFKYFSLGAFALGSIEVMYPDGPRTVGLSARITGDIKFPLDNQDRLRSYEGIVRAAYKADSAKLVIALRNIEEPLYNYYKSYEDFERWDSNNEGNVLPNLQEVRPIFSNIEGGIGIFGGFNETRTEFVIK